VTIAVLAAVGVEAVSRWLGTAGYERRILDRPPAWGLGLFLLSWAWILYRFHLPGAPIMHYGVAIAGVVAVAVCVPLKGKRWLPVCLTALLVLEIAAMRLW